MHRQLASWNWTQQSQVAKALWPFDTPPANIHISHIQAATDERSWLAKLAAEAEEKKLKQNIGRPKLEKMLKGRR